MARAGRQSNLSRYLVEGIPEMERTIRDLTHRDLEEAVLGVLEDIGMPTRRALINYYTGRTGKHDGESLKRAMSHRWWSRKRQQGLPVGFTRVLAARKLFTDGFGFKVAKLKRGSGFFLRIKAWGPGIHLVEKGRYKSNKGNNYTGWRSGLSILKRFESWAIGALNTRIGPAIEKAAQQAARRNGVRQ
jgi:hypothetical protein